jgi:hypothetical protein
MQNGREKEDLDYASIIKEIIFLKTSKIISEIT